MNKMNWLRQNWFRIGIIAILLIGLIFYAKHLQNLEINEEDTKRAEFIASRKRDCLEIYKAESQNLDVVQDWNYNQANDKCEITYKDSDPASPTECRNTYKTIIESVSDPKYKTEMQIEEMRCSRGIYKREF